MARPVSAKTEQIMAELRGRLRSGFVSPGSAFFSNRGLAQKFGVSYQTAHRILDKLAAENLLLRQRGSGSIVAGEVPELSEIAIAFHPRAEIKDTFGHYLREQLELEFQKRGLPFRRVRADNPERIALHQYPVFWNIEPIPNSFLRLRRHCLVLNNRPALGLSARWVDSISVDDYAGGLIAGELLRDYFKCRKVAVVGGPSGDRRSNERVRGFMDIFPAATRHFAGTWGRPVPRHLFTEIAQLRPDGVFCVNDRLAARFQQESPWQGARPAIIGFDNTPTAMQHNLTTVAIPWNLLVATAADTCQRRLTGNHLPAIDQILRLEPITRTS